MFKFSQHHLIALITCVVFVFVPFAKTVASQNHIVSNVDVFTTESAAKEQADTNEDPFGCLSTADIHKRFDCIDENYGGMNGPLTLNFCLSFPDKGEFYYYRNICLKRSARSMNSAEACSYLKCANCIGKSSRCLDDCTDDRRECFQSVTDLGINKKYFFVSCALLFIFLVFYIYLHFKLLWHNERKMNFIAIILPLLPCLIYWLMESHSIFILQIKLWSWVLCVANIISIFSVGLVFLKRYLSECGYESFFVSGLVILNYFPAVLFLMLASHGDETMRIFEFFYNFFNIHDINSGPGGYVVAFQIAFSPIIAAICLIVFSIRQRLFKKTWKKIIPICLCLFTGLPLLFLFALAMAG